MSGDPLLVLARSSGEKRQANAILAHVLSAISLLDVIWQARIIRGDAMETCPDPPILAVDFSSLAKDRAVSYKSLFVQLLSFPAHRMATALSTLPSGTRSLQMLTWLTQTAVPCHDLGITRQETTKSTLYLTTAQPSYRKLETIQRAVSHNIVKTRIAGTSRTAYRGPSAFSTRLYDLLGTPRFFDATDAEILDAPNDALAQAVADLEKSREIPSCIGPPPAHFRVQAENFKFFVRAPYGGPDGDSARIFLAVTIGAESVHAAIINPLVLPDRFGLRFMRLLGFTLPETNDVGDFCPYSYQGFIFDITHSIPYIVRLNGQHRVAYDVVVPVLCDGLLRGQDRIIASHRHVVYAPARVYFEPAKPNVELGSTNRFCNSPAGKLADRINGEIEFVTNNYAIAEIHFTPSEGRAASRVYQGAECKLTIYDTPDLNTSYPVSFFSALAIGSDVVDGAPNWGGNPMAQYPKTISTALPAFYCDSTGMLQGDAVCTATSGNLWSFLGSCIYGTYEIGPDREEYNADRRIFAPCLGPTPKATLARRGTDLAKIYALHRTEYLTDEEAGTYSIAYLTSGTAEIGGSLVTLSGDTAPYVMTTNALLLATSQHDDKFIEKKAETLGKIWHEYAITAAQDGTDWSNASAGAYTGGPFLLVPADLLPGARIDYAGTPALFGEEEHEKPICGITLPDFSRPYDPSLIAGNRTGVHTIYGVLFQIREAIQRLISTSDYHCSDRTRYAQIYGYIGTTPGALTRSIMALVSALMRPTGQVLKFVPRAAIMEIDLRPKYGARAVIFDGLALEEDEVDIADEPLASELSCANLDEIFQDSPPKALKSPKDAKVTKISPNHVRAPKIRIEPATEAARILTDSRAALRAVLAILIFGFVAPRTASHLHMNADLTEHSSEVTHQARIRLFSSTFNAYLAAPLFPGGPTRESVVTDLFQIVRAEYVKALQGYIELLQALIENQSDMDAAAPNAPFGRIITGFREAPRYFFSACGANITEAVNRIVPRWSFPAEAIVEWREIIEESATAAQNIERVFAAYPEHPFLYPPSHTVLLRECVRKHVLAASVGYEMAVYALRDLNARSGVSTLDAILSAAPRISPKDYIAYPITEAKPSPANQRVVFGLAPISTIQIGERRIHLANFSILSIASSAFQAIKFPSTVATPL